MKRILALVLTIAMTAVCFAGCAKKDASSDTTETTTAKYDTVSEVPAARIAQQMITPATAFAGGDGSEANPYQISTAEELAFLAQIMDNRDIDNTYNGVDYENKHYILTADIQVNDPAEIAQADTKAPTYGWEPIGSVSNPFIGVFDGDGHTVSGLYCIAAPQSVTGDGSSLAMFEAIKNAEVKNVTVADSYFYSYNAISSIAAIVGSSVFSSMDNCHTKAVNVHSVSSLDGTAALLGKTVQETAVTNCTTDGKVESDFAMEAAGIVTILNDGVIENCVNHAEVICHDGTAGGIVAGTFDSAQSSAMNKDNVYGTGYTQIKGCVNNGTITSDNYDAGGIVGHALSSNAATTIIDCENNGTINGSSDAAGIAARVNTSKNTIGGNGPNQGSLTIENCTNKGTVNCPGGRVGGIAAVLNSEDESTATVKNCANEGDLASGDTIGGIVGMLLSRIESSATTVIDGCTNSGKIGDNESGSVAGIIAYIAMMDKGSEESKNENVSANSVTISNCANHSAIQSPASFAGGAIIGQVMASASVNDSLVIDGCSNDADISFAFESATMGFGGCLIGIIDSITAMPKTVKNCTNSGNITATVKNTKAADIKPEEDICYCFVGGIAGAASEDTVFENCTNTGSFTLTEGEEKDITFQNDCGLKFNPEDGFSKGIFKQMSDNYEAAKADIEE